MFENWDEAPALGHRVGPMMPPPQFKTAMAIAFFQIDSIERWYLCMNNNINWLVVIGMA